MIKSAAAILFVYLCTLLAVNAFVVRPPVPRGLSRQQKPMVLFAAEDVPEKKAKKSRKSAKKKSKKAKSKKAKKAKSKKTSKKKDVVATTEPEPEVVSIADDPEALEAAVAADTITFDPSTMTPKEQPTVDGPIVFDNATATDAADQGNVTAEVGFSKPSYVVIEKPKRYVRKYGEPYYGPNITRPKGFKFDINGGRPTSIIESEADLDRKAEMFREIEDGRRVYPAWFKDFDSPINEYAAILLDDEVNMDVSNVGIPTVFDLKPRFDYEWGPSGTDPNAVPDNGRYLMENPKDEEGIEIGWDPLYGHYNPVDYRTQKGFIESYIVDKETRNDETFPQIFPKGDLEIKYNEKVTEFRNTIEKIETYEDPYAKIQVPSTVVQWHGYEEELGYPQKNFTNNRFTRDEDRTNFEELTPYEARVKAVELARAKNAEWLPDGVSQEWHRRQRQPYEDYKTLVGTLKKGECDPDLVEQIQPVLKVLDACVELLSIENGTVFRFHYYGLMKNRYGMECWTKLMIEECGVEVTGVVFETGFRERDYHYDGGDQFYAPVFSNTDTIN